MKKIYGFLFLFLLAYSSIIAQTNGDYRSAQSGLWSSNVWEKYVSGAWDDAGGLYYAAPNTVNSGVTITVRNYVAIAGSSSGEANAHTVTNNGVINVVSGQTFQMGYSSGFPPTNYYGNLVGSGELHLPGDLSIVNGYVTIGSGGTLSDEGTTLSGASKLTINGTYDYTINGGSLPVGITWGGSSILKFSGVIDTWPGFQPDSYNDFEFASSGLTTNLEFNRNDVSKFTNINISNTGSYAITTDAGDLTTVSGNLTIGASGKLIIGASDKLTVNGTLANNATSADLVIESNSSRTGSLISNSTGVSGTFKQYMSSGRWYLVSPPFSGIDSYDYWDGTNDAYMRPYNSPGGGWGSYYSSPATSLNVGEGYEYWQTGSAITFNQTGTFITGNQTLSVSSGGATDPDWNLIGNPYPCGLDWSQVADRSHVDGSSFYVYTSSGYKTHNGTSGTATSAVIPPFQGFFVKYNNTGDISIANDDKAHAGIKLYKSVKSNYYNHFKVKTQFGDQESVCVIYQQDDATNGEDPLLDASILFNNDPNFMEVYSLAGEKKSAINIFGDYPYSVYLGFRVPEGGGEFTIEPFDLRNLDATFSIVLEDLETGTSFDFLENPSYTFTVSEGGLLEDRIILHLNSTVGFEDIKDNNTIIYSNRNRIYIDNKELGSYDIQVMNMMGQMVYERHVNSNGLQSIALNEPTAYYLIRVITEDKTITKKLFLAN